jgi:DNA-binding MarR family transcriptional regulator
MIDIAAVKAKIDLPDLAGQLTRLSRSGDGWIGLCPFHDDKSPSLSISQKGGIWLFKCHACDAQGDVISWIMKTGGVDFKEALSRAIAMAGIQEAPRIRSKATAPPQTAVKPLDAAIADEYHAKLTPERRAYYRGRGFTDETIDTFKLGWNGRRYSIPVFVGGELQNVRLRRDDENLRDRSAKMMPFEKGRGSTVFNQDALQGADIAIITEGEFDAILLCQNGWTAVSGTAGCETFLEEWAELFDAVRAVYICYDNDLPGQSGASKVATILGERAREQGCPDKVRIVDLPEEVGEGGDVTDFFARLGRTSADWQALLQDARTYEPQGLPIAEQPILVHLAQAARADLVGKLVKVRILVAGKVDSPYLVPKKIKFDCYASEDERDRCTNPFCNASGHWQQVIPDSDKTLIQLCQKTEKQVYAILKEATDCRGNCRKVTPGILEHVSVVQILAVPMADRVAPTEVYIDPAESDATSVIDLAEEAATKHEFGGNEYVARELYLVGHDVAVKVNDYYEITGRVYPHPNSQQATMLITELKPLADSIAQFKLTPAIRESFKVFQPDGAIQQHLDLLLGDLINNVTRIYKRDEALLAVLLTYHSILKFSFEGHMLQRGWVETLLIGDSGQGKSEIVRTIMDYSGLGVFVSGETTSRTGLTYAMEQLGERWFIKWGKYPLNDGRLLAIDEMSELRLEDLAQMTQGRNDGILRVDRTSIGERNCRTRLIWMTNPRKARTLYSYSHGVESLRDLFPAPADLRRIDFVVMLATKDVDVAEINKLHALPKEVLVSSEALKSSILWAWSRGPNDVVIDLETTKAILTEATRLSATYGSADDIPVVSPADMRIKIARLAVALAALLHSTDETHERVIVTPAHVNYIGWFIDIVYTSQNCRYDVYAGHAKTRQDLTDKEVKVIQAELNELDRRQSLDCRSSEDIIELYRKSETITTQDIIDQLDLDRKAVTARLRILQRHGLIMRGRNRGDNGFAKTPKFVDYLMRIDEAKDAEQQTMEVYEGEVDDEESL